MQKTTKYQLNQWAPEDRILHTDFNRDNENLENALSGLDAAVAAERSAREAAVAGAKAEAADAVAAAQSALNSSKADKSALNALSARVDAVPFVKLRDITTSAAASQVDVDISDIDLRQYAMLVIVPRLDCGDEFIYMRANGVDSYRQGNYIYHYMGRYRAEGAKSNVVIRLFGQEGAIHAWTEWLTARLSGDEQMWLEASSGVTVDTMETLNFLGDSGGSIAAGGRIVIYGVKF